MSKFPTAVDVLFVHGAGWADREQVERDKKAGKYADRSAKGIRAAGLRSQDFPLRVISHVGTQRSVSLDHLSKLPQASSSPHGLPSGKVSCPCCSRSLVNTGRKHALRVAKKLDVHDRLGPKIAPWEVRAYIADPLRLVNRLEPLSNDLPERPWILWGHSLGSIIAAELAAHLAPAQQPSVLVTSGCPLNIDFIREGLLSGVHDWLREGRSVPWVNAYDAADPIAKNKGLHTKSFGPIVDVKVRNEKPHSGSRHLAHAAVWATIADSMAVSSAS